MPKSYPIARQPHVQGQIQLERALFCIGCEVIFTGTVQCPRCAGGTVWPLAEWLGSSRSTPATVLLPSDIDPPQPSSEQRTPSAA
jgi:hypothetical protein